MKQVVTKFTSLGAALKELEPYVRDGQHLKTGRPFKNLKLLSREAFANWLLCAVINVEHGEETMTFGTGSEGSDGIIFDIDTKEEAFRTEHVYVPSQETPGSQLKDVEALILEGIANKQSKGSAYASGKVLVVFVDAAGKWNPNDVASRRPEPLDFETVWVIALQEVEDRRYVYNVAQLDLQRGTAPIWRVIIAPDFCSWKVQPFR